MDSTAVCSFVLSRVTKIISGVHYYEMINQHCCQTLHQASFSLQYPIDSLWGSCQVLVLSVVSKKLVSRRKHDVL